MPRATHAQLLRRHGIVPPPSAEEMAGADRDFLAFVGEPGPAKPKRKTSARPEDAFHIALAKQLRYAIAPPGCCNSDGVMWFSVEQASGGLRQIRARNGAMIAPGGIRNKNKGVVSGVPDVFVLHAGRAFWLELKAGKNSTSDNQDAVHAALGRAGSRVAVCYSVDQALATLRIWGVPLRSEVMA